MQKMFFPNPSLSPLNPSKNVISSGILPTPIGKGISIRENDVDGVKTAARKNFPLPCMGRARVSLL